MITPLVYTTCDPAYFERHGEAFRRSAEQHGHECRIDVVTDVDPAFAHAEPRIFYCYKRWLMLPELLARNPAVLVSDIDSIFNGRIDVHPSWDIGLFFRPHLSHLALKVLCAASYWKASSLPFAKQIRDRILAGPKEWGFDQASIYQQYLEDWDKYSILRLDSDFLNYAFDKEAKIWTAKGPRKSNPVYLERAARYAA